MDTFTFADVDFKDEDMQDTSLEEVSQVYFFFINCDISEYYFDDSLFVLNISIEKRENYTEI